MKPPLSILLAGFVLLAGCSGTPIQSPTESETLSTTSATTETRATVNASNVVEYAALQPAAQRVFRRALEHGEISEVTNVSDDAMRPLVDADYVRYNGNLYGVTAQPQLTPRRVLTDIKRVNQSSIENQNTVVVYDNLSEEGQDAFKTVLSGNQSSVKYSPGEFPLPGDPFDDNSTYIRYENAYYELGLAHADDWSYYVKVTTKNGS